VLAVVTSCDAFPDGTPTGLWLSELADAFYEFQAAGCDMTIASPKGGAVPLDPASLEPGALTEPATRFMADPETKQLLEHSVPLASISDDAGAYSAIYLPGGHGPLLDLARDDKVAALASAAFAAGKTVAAVCHGPAGLLGARDGDRPLVAGRRVAAFTAEEERAVGRRDKAP
jgi:putative intracellular protease/amidase